MQEGPTERKIKELIGIAVGEASMCWDPRPGNMIFDSTNASRIVDELSCNILDIISSTFMSYQDRIVELQIAVVEEMDECVRQHTENDRLRDALEAIGRHYFNKNDPSDPYHGCACGTGCDMGESGEPTDEFGHDEGCPIAMAGKALLQSRQVSTNTPVKENYSQQMQSEYVTPRWIVGRPDEPHASEWFIAKLKDGCRTVLRALPKNYSYDFKTADETYYTADWVVAWMQFPDSEFVPAQSEPASTRPCQHEYWVSDEDGTRCADCGYTSQSEKENAK